MKKSIVLLLLVSVAMLLATNAYAGDSEAFEFRDGVKFGMTIDEVKALETSIPDVESDTILVYRNQLAANNAAEVLYSMSEDTKTLEEIAVSFTTPLIGAEAFFDDFDTIDQLLIDKYGAENHNFYYVFYDATYSNSPEDYPTAFMLSQLKYQSQWIFSDYIIDHELFRSEDGTIYHIIWYYTVTEEELAAHESL